MLNFSLIIISGSERTHTFRVGITGYTVMAYQAEQIRGGGDTKVQAEDAKYLLIYDLQ